MGRKQILHDLAFVLQVALQQTHRLGRHDRRLALRGMTAVRRRQALGHRQTPAIRRHEPHLVRFQFPQHARHRNASRILGGGEDGAADHLTQTAGRDFVILLIRERRDVGKLGRVFAGHLKFDGWTAHDTGVGVRFHVELAIAALAQDGDEFRRRQNGIARFVNHQALHVETNTQLQVGRHDGAAPIGGNGLEVPQNGLHVPSRQRGTGQLARR